MERLLEEVGKKNRREEYILFPIYPYQLASYTKPEHLCSCIPVFLYPPAPVFLLGNNVAYEQFLQANTCPLFTRCSIVFFSTPLLI